jgi:hypothetical protein
MKIRFMKTVFLYLSALSLILLACNALTQIESAVATEEVVPIDVPTLSPAQNGFPDRPAIPNDSGIEGVQTFPDKTEYHNHVDFVPEPEGDLPPAVGAHYRAWQNCGIYDQPIELGSALHSLEHGAVWLTYSPDLSAAEIADLQNLARGQSFVLMSPYPAQTKPVVLSAWTVQLVIDSLPDDRIAQFITYYQNGPQNPEPGAPCSGAIGTPLE